MSDVDHSNETMSLGLGTEPTAPPAPATTTMSLGLGTEAPATAPVLQTPEKARQQVLSLSDDPAQAAAKLDASKAIGDWLKIHPVTVHQNFDALTQAIYGDQVKGQQPTTVWQKVRNTFDGLKIQGEIDDLSGKQYLGDSSPETAQRVKDLQAQQKTLGPVLGNVPQQVAGMAFQLGYQGYHAAGTLVDTGLSVLSPKFQQKVIVISLRIKELRGFPGL